MNRLIRFLLSLLILQGSLAFAQTQPVHVSQTLVYRYDLDATAETYCSLSQREVAVSVRIAAATSTTVTGTGAFTNVAVGDMIFGTDSLAGGGETYTAVVVARASANSITVESALTLTSATLFYRTLTCGTGATDGAFPVSRYHDFTVQFDVDQLNVTGGIDGRLLCKTSPGAQWAQVYPVLSAGTVTPSYVNLSAVGPWLKEVSGAYDQCRVGMLIHTSDDGGDTGSNSERVTITIKGRN